MREGEHFTVKGFEIEFTKPNYEEQAKKASIGI